VSITIIAIALEWGADLYIS